MPAEHDRLEALFLSALELPAGEREAWLADAVGDAALRDEVLSLLREHEASGPLDGIADRIGAVAARRAESLPPEHRVGAYEIIRPIAHGGMGSVYLARRADGAFDYEVALKLLRRDLETDELRRRFLVERQILARITHPNIARLLDGGVTDGDRPYFVMEHVDGAPIDAYCNRQRLPVARRLELFRTVCAAVQHAHRNLVVHRDLKPTNILVTADGTVKLLDFGIAKVLDLEAFPRFAARTETGVRLLTPEYASPEQLRADQVTTASDVYQLGLLLHLLLTGSVPRLADGALVAPGATTSSRDVEKPSTIVSAAGRRPAAGTETVAPDARDVAAARGTTPERLRRRLAGDLDNIVLLALREEPERRYASVERLDDDIRRHLEGLPVRARPERLGYVAAKFVRRHRAAVAVAAALAVLLAGFAVAMGVQAGRIADERDRAQQVSGLLIDMFEAASPRIARGDTMNVFDLLDRGADEVRTSLADRPALRGTMMGVLADVYAELGQFIQAADLAFEAVDAWEAAAGPGDPRTVAHIVKAAAPLAQSEHLDSALAVAEQAVARAPWRSGRNGLVRARALQAAAYVHQVRGERAHAAALLVEAIALFRRVPGDSARLGLASALVNRGYLHENAGHLDSAIAMLRESVALRQALLDEEHPLYLNSLGGLADLLRRQGRLDEAESLIVRGLELKRRYYPADHPQLSSALGGYASLLSDRGELDSAEHYYRAALEAERSAPGHRTTGHAGTLHEFGLFLQWRRRDPAAAEPLFREAAAIYASVRGPRDAWTAQAEVSVATALLPQGRFREADAIFRRVIPALEETYPPASPALAPAFVNHGLVLTRLGRLSEAEVRLRRAHDIAVATGNPRAIVPAEASLGMLLVEQGRLAEARPFLERAWRTLENGPPGLLREWTEDALGRL